MILTGWAPAAVPPIDTPAPKKPTPVSLVKRYAGTRESWLYSYMFAPPPVPRFEVNR